MDNERWKAIESLYHAAAEINSDERAEFLQKACDGDKALITEVESLLLHDELHGNSFDRKPPFGAWAQSMNLVTGTRIGPYEIKSPLGEGGMGVVYRAHDTKLGRDVAIKTLPDAFTNDRDRLEQLQREAQVLASLNHPNVAQIYGLEESGNLRCIVMEFVDGDTVEDRLKRGPISVDEALPIAKQIAEALEAAHEKGIIHRDLKPANIKLTSDGKVKVLDFGLAKPFQQQQAAVLLNSPPVLNASRPGMLLGTAAYMSPEQAKGKEADRRSDVWAFGCVLYEMLTGRKAFGGETITDVLSGIIKAEPDWKALPQSTPANVNLLLRRCLQKDPRHRVHDMADARIEIEERTAREAVGLAAPRRWKLAWLLAVVMTTLLVIVAVLYFGRPEPGPELRVEVNTPQTDDLMSFAVSPDGQNLVFAASTEGKTRLWIRALESVAAQPLPGTEGASFPFWSPDSRALGFFADGKLKRIDVAGGPPRVLANASIGRGGTWNRDGIIVFAPAANGPLYRISAGGGEAVEVTKLESTRHVGDRFPQFLPDGRHFIFNSPGSLEGRGLYLGSLDSTRVRRLADADSQAIYVRAGYLLFVRQEALLAQRFDLSSFQLEGEPTAVVEKVGSDPLALLGAFSSAGGILAYRGAGSISRQLVWFDRSGKSVGVVGSPDKDNPSNPNIAPDGHSVALDRQVGGNLDVWLLDITRGVATRFSFDPAVERGPVWSPDGSRMLFGSRRNGIQDLYEKPSSGGGPEQLLLASPNNKMPTDWSADGRFILYREVNPNTGYDLFALPLFGDRKPRPVTTSEFDERDGQFSPDGRWLAYGSNESGRFEVYVQSFPGPDRKLQVSADGGTQPRWRHDGKELFYISLDSKLMAVRIAASPDGKMIKADSPQALFPVQIAGGPTPGATGANNQQYAVSPDDQRFLVNVTTDPASIPINLILNWHPHFKK